MLEEYIEIEEGHLKTKDFFCASFNHMQIDCKWAVLIFEEGEYGDTIETYALSPLQASYQALHDYLEGESIDEL